MHLGKCPFDSISYFTNIQSPKRGIRRKFTAKYEKHDHWLDYASDKYDRQLIEDIKRVLSVTVVFIPLPVFWALYDQQVNYVHHNDRHMEVVGFHS